MSPKNRNKDPESGSDDNSSSSRSNGSYGGSSDPIESGKKPLDPIDASTAGSNSNLSSCSIYLDTSNLNHIDRNDRNDHHDPNTTMKDDANEVRSLATMDTNTFRRLRDTRRNYKERLERNMEHKEHRRGKDKASDSDTTPHANGFRKKKKLLEQLCHNSGGSGEEADGVHDGKDLRHNHRSKSRNRDGRNSEVREVDDSRVRFRRCASVSSVSSGSSSSINSYNHQSFRPKHSSNRSCNSSISIGSTRSLIYYRSLMKMSLLFSMGVIAMVKSGIVQIDSVQLNQHMEKAGRVLSAVKAVKTFGAVGGSSGNISNMNYEINAGGNAEGGTLAGVDEANVINREDDTSEISNLRGGGQHGRRELFRREEKPTQDYGEVSDEQSKMLRGTQEDSNANNANYDVASNSAEKGGLESIMGQGTYDRIVQQHKEQSDEIPRVEENVPFHSNGQHPYQEQEFQHEHQKYNQYNEQQHQYAQQQQQLQVNERGANNDFASSEEMINANSGMMNPSNANSIFADRGRTGNGQISSWQSEGNGFNEMSNSNQFADNRFHENAGRPSNSEQRGFGIGHNRSPPESNFFSGMGEYPNGDRNGFNNNFNGLRNGENTKEKNDWVKSIDLDVPRGNNGDSPALMFDMGTSKPEDANGPNGTSAFDHGNDASNHLSGQLDQWKQSMLKEQEEFQLQDRQQQNQFVQNNVPQGRAWNGDNVNEQSFNGPSDEQQHSNFSNGGSNVELNQELNQFSKAMQDERHLWDRSQINPHEEQLLKQGISTQVESPIQHQAVTGNEVQQHREKMIPQMPEQQQFQQEPNHEQLQANMDTNNGQTLYEFQDGSMPTTHAGIVVSNSEFQSRVQPSPGFHSQKQEQEITHGLSREPRHSNEEVQNAMISGSSPQGNVNGLPKQETRGDMNAINEYALNMQSSQNHDRQEQNIGQHLPFEPQEQEQGFRDGQQMSVDQETQVQRGWSKSLPRDTDSSTSNVYLSTNQNARQGGQNLQQKVQQQLEQQIQAIESQEFSQYRQQNSRGRSSRASPQERIQYDHNNAMEESQFSRQGQQLRGSFAE